MCRSVTKLCPTLCKWVAISFSYGNPLQCSCLEDPRDRVAWWEAVYGVAQSRTRLKWLSSSSKLQHTRLPCPSLYPRVCSNSCPLSQWCCPTISFSVTPFSSCPQSFPESKSFPMSWLFASGDHSIGTSASVSVLPNEYSGLISFDWFDLLAVQGTLKSLLQH